MTLESIRINTNSAGISETIRIDVAGEIDVCTFQEFKSAISEAIESGAKNLIIDLSSVTYMDSSGFGTLLTAAKKLKPSGGSINLIGSSEAVLRMLRITKLDTIFGVYPSLQEAISALKPPT